MVNTNGKNKTAATWNNSVRIKEIIADTSPLFKAVKKDDAKILAPANKNPNEKMKKPRTVICSKSGLYPTNSLDTGTAKASAAPSIHTDMTATTVRLFRKTFFNSSCDFAP